MPPGVPAPAGTAPDVVLRPYDQVLIKRQSEWMLPRTVSVQGEVKSPGEYTLTTKSDRLSDIVSRAGGLTASAYAGGIVFVRRRSANERAGGDLPAQMRIGVDLPAVLRDPRTPDNITLVDGDSIFIPQYTPVVIVRGAVNAPTGIAYLPGADIDYYVRSAGGETIKGDFGRAYVAQPGGKLETKHRHFLFGISRPMPKPGSTVVVPDKDPTSHFDWIQLGASIASVAASLVGIIAVAKR
jgi:polysaccharide biosynthesis/export protein